MTVSVGWRDNDGRPSVAASGELPLGKAPPDAVAAATRFGRDIADGYICEIEIPARAGSESKNFRAEFFSNTYNVFCLLTPPK